MIAEQIFFTLSLGNEKEMRKILDKSKIMEYNIYL